LSALQEAWLALVRLGFRLLYNEMAFTYDAVSYVVSLGEWRAWQYGALDLLTTDSRRILELAHGTGHVQGRLHATGYWTVGLDLSRMMGRIARRRLRAAGAVPRLVNGTAARLPFASAAFDAVVCTFPTAFIVQPDVLWETRRVLRPGGRLIVVLNGVLDGSSPVQRFIDFLYRITGQGRSDSLAPFASRFADAGFEVEMVTMQCVRSVAQTLVAHKPQTDTGFSTAAVVL
jgi:ubiquinone/menaquinone biosynthesis C-methylase UbiE